jgi:large subunit ribosomal protein L5
MSTKPKALKMTSKEYYDTARITLSKNIKDSNQFNLSSIEKLSINIGIGDYKNDSKARADINDYLVSLTGQKPKLVNSKLNIAGFKLRKGEPVGYSVTLRGKKMNDFLIYLIYIALPRSRDFKGIKDTSFDPNFKSYSLGIPSATIFPAIGFDSNVKFGMQINLVFKSIGENNKKLLETLNFPFKK